jgi:hypothetical protein
MTAEQEREVEKLVRDLNLSQREESLAKDVVDKYEVSPEEAVAMVLEMGDCPDPKVLDSNQA